MKSGFLKIGFTLVVLFYSLLPSYGQRVMITWLDSAWDLTVKQYASYYRVGVIDTIERKYFGDVNEFYLDGSKEMTGYFSANVKIDTFRFYYPGGKLFYKGHYADNKRRGIWSYYYPNGQLMQNVYFSDQFLSVFQSYDSLGNAKIINGTGDWDFRYYDDLIQEMVWIKGSFLDSLKDGHWAFYHKVVSEPESKYQLLVEEFYNKGKHETTLLYRDNQPNQILNRHSIIPETVRFSKMEKWSYGKLASIEAYPRLEFLPHVDSSYFPVHKEAVFPGGVDSLKSYLSSEIHLPKDYLEYQRPTTVQIRFRITSNGDSKTEKDYKSNPRYNTDDGIFYDKLARVLNNMPRWKPAMRNNYAVVDYFTIEGTLKNGKLSFDLHHLNKIIREEEKGMASENQN